MLVILNIRNVLFGNNYWAFCNDITWWEYDDGDYQDYDVYDTEDDDDDNDYNDDDNNDNDDDDIHSKSWISWMEKSADYLFVLSGQLTLQFPPNYVQVLHKSFIKPYQHCMFSLKIPFRHNILVILIIYALFGGKFWRQD